MDVMDMGKNTKSLLAGMPGEFSRSWALEDPEPTVEDWAQAEAAVDRVVARRADQGVSTSSGDREILRDRLAQQYARYRAKNVAKRQADYRIAVEEEDKPRETKRPLLLMRQARSEPSDPLQRFAGLQEPYRVGLVALAMQGAEMNAPRREELSRSCGAGNLDLYNALVLRGYRVTAEGYRVVAVVAQMCFADNWEKFLPKPEDAPKKRDTVRRYDVGGIPRIGPLEEDK